MKQFNAGQYINQGSYRSFLPNPVNRQWYLDDAEIIELLSQANRDLGRLDMYSEHTPNIDLFISMHVTKEATTSSKIEGTHTNIEDALKKKDELIAEKRDDWEEVQNYIKALNTSITSLESLPTSSRLIRKAHEILLTGVRGTNKLPGEYRRSQNWIGGSSLRDAVFVPPHHTEVDRLMGDLENFLHSNEIRFPLLLRIALAHYQFETIHPFLDGNGRVGRLLITLYLVEKKILDKPILYLSVFFEQHRSLYYQNLMLVRETNNIKQWFKFFLVGIIDTAESSIKTFDNIMKLQKKTDEQIQSLGSRAANAKLVINQLYNNPITDSRQVAEVTGLSMPSTYTLIRKLEELQILQEYSGDKRNKRYIFDQYLDLFR